MLAVSFTTVRGTALTEYRWARCGNSVTSTKSAVTRSLSTQLLGQPHRGRAVGSGRVENTWQVRGLNDLR